MSYMKSSQTRKTPNYFSNSTDPQCTNTKAVPSITPKNKTRLTKAPLIYDDNDSYFYSFDNGGLKTIKARVRPRYNNMPKNKRRYKDNSQDDKIASKVKDLLSDLKQSRMVKRNYWRQSASYKRPKVTQNTEPNTRFVTPRNGCPSRRVRPHRRG